MSSDDKVKNWKLIAEHEGADKICDSSLRVSNRRKEHDILQTQSTIWRRRKHYIPMTKVTHCKGIIKQFTELHLCPLSTYIFPLFRHRSRMSSPLHLPILVENCKSQCSLRIFLCYLESVFIRMHGALYLLPLYASVVYSLGTR